MSHNIGIPKNNNQIMPKIDKRIRYIKDNSFTENIPLPILCNGERLWLDDVLKILNNNDENESLCTLEIYADGSCNHQEGYGAWAIVSNKFQDHGIINAENIGYVELYAVYKALLKAQGYRGDVVIYTDSQYVYSNVNWKSKEYECLGWKSKSWRKRIPNKELLQEIVPLMKPNIRVEKINRKDNKCADRLASKTMKEHLKNILKEMK